MTEGHRAEHKLEKRQTGGFLSDNEEELAALQEDCKGLKKKKRNFTGIIALNCHKPLVLFKTIDFMLKSQISQGESTPSVFKALCIFIRREVT